MEPVHEEGFFAALAHAGDGEVVFLSGEQTDPVFVDGANLADRDLHAAVRIIRAVEYDAAGVQGQLA